MRPTGLAAVIVLLVAAVPGFADASEPTGRLLVSLESTGTEARAAAPAVVARASGRLAGPRVPEIGLVTVRPDDGSGTLADLSARLQADPRVRAVALERRATPRVATNDPALTDLETAPKTPAGTTLQWWAARTGLFEAWDVATGAGSLVAVIDSGVDGGHPELAGKIRSTIDADPTPGAPGPLRDESGHGSHVASLACAAADNGIGIVGAGRDCGLLVAKTDFSDASIAAAVVDAANRGADAVALAFGTDGRRVPPTALVDALHHAAARGSVLVAAAADQETEEQGDPANILQPTGTGPDLASSLGLSITAATLHDRRASFAGRGSQISMAAYGAFDQRHGPRGLLGAFPAHQTSLERPDEGGPPCRCRTSLNGDSRYAYLQGTSMATGIVAGVAASVRRFNPDLSSSDVVRLLKETARRPPGTGWNPDLGWGLVDAGAVIAVARTIDRRAPSSRVRRPARKRTRRRVVRLRWRGRDTSPPGVDASGIVTYELWRARGRRAPARIASTHRRSRRIKVRRPGRYRFFTVAVDGAGNREAKPRRADARLRVLRSRRR